MQFFAKEFNELSKRELYEILKSRSQIFIVENNMRCLDMDGADYNALHCFLWENDSVIAYLRAIALNNNEVKIGRVLTLNHGIGLGREIMNKSINEIKKRFGCKKIILHSQLSAKGFYEKLGFKTTSGGYLEENVLHVSMEKDI